jgi:nucleoside-diphosphate-sugar epimerase
MEGPFQIREVGTVRVLVAGASGVIGRPLVALLLRAGHEVAGITRSVLGAGLVRDLGAEAVVCDVLDRSALVAQVAELRPEVIIHELTDLPDDPSAIDEHMAAHNRIRREGTANLIVAMAACGASRLLAQSVAWEIPGDGGDALACLERLVLDAGGVVLRYGTFYGPGTYYPTSKPPPPRIHVERAAARTAELLDAPSGIVVIDEADGQEEQEAELS